MKSSFLSKEIIAVTLGILLIAGTTALTFLRTDTNKKTKELTVVSSKESELKKFFDTVSYIQPEALQQEIFGNSLLVLDMRNQGMYDLNHIPESLLATPDTAVSLFQKQKPTPEKVVLVDESGQTETLKATMEKLRAAEIKNISVLSEGFGSWGALGHQTVSWGDPDSITDHAKVHAISIENTRKLFNDKQVLFVDVRSKESFNKDHRPDSVNIPLDSIESLAKTLPSTQMLIVYGESPLDSFQAGVHLFDLGYLLAYTLNGGYIDIKQ